jgi:hypothetical protein
MVAMVTKTLKDVIQHAESWPEEDQAELVELAREIEARRSGVYLITDDERAAVDEARRGGFVRDEEMTAFWKRFGVL